MCIWRIGLHLPSILQWTKSTRPDRVFSLQHLDKTPNQYIQWRYATGEDREGVDSVFRKATEEEEKKMAQAVKGTDGTKKVKVLPALLLVSMFHNMQASWPKFL